MIDRKILRYIIHLSQFKRENCANKSLEILITIFRYAFLFLLTLTSQLCQGQSYEKLWGLATYFGRYEQLLYTVEPQIRLVERSGIYEQSLINVGIGKTIMPEWQIWLGQTYNNYSNTNNITEDVEAVTLNEYRIWEQLIWRKPFAQGFASRTRLEQRRAFQSNEWAVRLRERLYWTTPVSETVSFALNDEIFLNLQDATWVASSSFDQNRLYIGIFYSLTPKIGINISYMNQYVARTPSEINNGIILNLITYMY